MAKKITAVTNIKHNGEVIDAGSEVDGSKFTKEQLKELYDNGAVTIEDGPDTPDTEAPKEPEAEATPTKATTAPAKATGTTTKTTDKQ